MKQNYRLYSKQQVSDTNKVMDIKGLREQNLGLLKGYSESDNLLHEYGLLGLG